MANYIHGQTDPREVARLEKQAQWGAHFILRDFRAEPGERVLDLATGVGAMAGQLHQRFPGIRLTGVDLRRTQLASAKANHPIADYVQADATRMPFRDGAFDRVHCSWLLEHVPDPVAILREVRRIVRPGGTVQFIEVDNATFRTVPAFPEVIEVMSALNRAQQEGGGDPYVGRKLGQLFLEAGFEHLALERAVVHGTHADPVGLQGAIDEFAEIFESLDEALESTLGEKLRTGAAQVRSLAKREDGELYYAGVIAVAGR